MKCLFQGKLEDCEDLAHKSGRRPKPIRQLICIIRLRHKNCFVWQLITVQAPQARCDVDANRRPSVPHRLNSIDLVNLRNFYRRRFARVMPLLAAAAIGMMTYLIAFRGGGPGSLWRPTFLTGSGLFALHVPGMISITTGAWSLAIEVLFYAVFPIVALLAAHSSTKTLLIVFAVLVFAQQTLLSTLPDSNDPAFWAGYTMPLTFAPFFAGGFLIHRLRGSDQPWALVASFAALVVLFGYSAVVKSDVFRAGPQYLFLTSLSLAAVYFAYRAIMPSWLGPVSRFFGDISYSLYLTHWFVYQTVIAWFPPALWFPAFAVGAVLLAWLLMKFFETPLRRRLSSGRSDVQQA